MTDQVKSSFSVSNLNINVGFSHPGSSTGYLAQSCLSQFVIERVFDFIATTMDKIGR